MFDDWGNRRMWNDNPLAKTWEELGFNAYEARHYCFEGDGGDDGGGGNYDDVGDIDDWGGVDPGGPPGGGTDTEGGVGQGLGGETDNDSLMGGEVNDTLDPTGSVGTLGDPNMADDEDTVWGPEGFIGWGDSGVPGPGDPQGYGGWDSAPPDLPPAIDVKPSKLSAPLGLTDEQAKALGYDKGFGLRGNVEKSLKDRGNLSDSKIAYALNNIDVKTTSGPISLNPDISYEAQKAAAEEEEESWFENLVEFFFGGKTTDEDQADKDTASGVRGAQDNITQTAQGLEAAMDLNSGFGSLEIADVFGQNPNRGKGSYDATTGNMTTYGQSSGLIGSPATSVVAATVGLPLGVQVARGLLGAARAETPLDVVSSAAGLATMVPNEAIAGIGAMVGAGTGALKGVDALGGFVEDELDINNPFSGIVDSVNRGLTNLGGSMSGTTGGSSGGGSGVSGGLGGSDINTDVGGDDFTDPSITAPRSSDPITTRTSTPLMETTVAENMPLSATTFGRRPGQDMPYGVVSPFMNVTDDLNSVSIGSTYGSPRAGRMRQAA